jgi:heat-inducible transcriptional repressor
MNDSKVLIARHLENRDLSSRERDILTKIIHLYILNSTPVGSRNLAKYLEQTNKLSPATIRNVMSDLEEMDYISHPHTSAGRIPTDKGYRFYVDSMTEIEQSSDHELNAVRSKLTGVNTPDEVLRGASKLLGMLSNYLSVVAFPYLTDFIIQKIDLIALSSTRLLAVVALESNVVRTVTLEASFDVDGRHLEEIKNYINEKISGRTLGFVRENFNAIITDYRRKDAPLIRLFVDSVDKIFDKQSGAEKIHIAGTHNLLENTEMEDLSRVKGIIELIENEDIIIHLMDKHEDSEGIKVMIGKELQNALFDDYSMIVSSYQIGGGTGSIGLIGPKRMNYSKMISLVKLVSDTISR